jgi:hypothetical protein
MSIMRLLAVAFVSSQGLPGAASGQLMDILEPTTGAVDQCEYIGVGNAGDLAFVYWLHVGGNVANESNGFFLEFLDGSGAVVQQTAKFGDALNDASAGICQEVVGSGGASISNGEVWRLDLRGQLGAAIPVGSVRVALYFDTDNSGDISPGDHRTPIDADGDNVPPSTELVDETLEIVTTRSIPNAAFFDGSGANTDLFVTFTTPTVGLDPAFTARIPLFGKADVDGGISGDTTQSANSVQPGGGSNADFEFQDGNQFGSNTGLAGTVDINAGSFAQPAGTTNVLNFDFDDANSGLDQGNAFRRDNGSPSTSTVRDSAGNLITNALVGPTQLQPLMVSAVNVLQDTVNQNVNNIEVVYNRPLNPGAFGDVAFYNNTNAAGNAIQLVVNGTAQNVPNLDPTGVTFDPTMPDRVRLNVSGAGTVAQNIWTDALSVGSGGDASAGSFQHSFSVTGTVPQASFGAAPAYNTTQTLAMNDLAQPRIAATRTVDDNGDGVVDGYDVVFSETIANYTGNTGIELNKVAAPVQPITGVDIYTGMLPAPVNTFFDNVSQINNLLPLTSVATIDGDFQSPTAIARDGVISPRETGNTVRLLADPFVCDFDSDGTNFSNGDADELLPDTASFPYNVTWNNTNAAVNNQANTGTVTLNPAAAVTDGAGNTFTNDTTFPFDTPVLVQAVAGTDGAPPAAVAILRQPGDNQPPDAEFQMFAEQDGVFGDQPENDRLFAVASESLLWAPEFDESTITYGQSGDRLGAGSLLARLPGYLQGFANTLSFTLEGSSDPLAFGPGVVCSLPPAPYPAGVVDSSGNPFRFTNALVEDGSAPYAALRNSVFRSPFSGVVAGDEDLNGLVDVIDSLMTQPIDPASVDVLDFAISPGRLLGAEVFTADPHIIRFYVDQEAPHQVSIGTPIELTYTSGAFATLIRAEDSPAGTGAALSVTFGPYLPQSVEVVAGDVPDCNENGVPDALDVASGDSQDCNENGILDECDIVEGREEDCDGDEVLDRCQTERVDLMSDELAPFGGGVGVHAVFSGLPSAGEHDVLVIVEASGDLGALTEFIDVSLNGTALGSILQFEGTECPEAPDEALLVIDPVVFSGLVSAGVADFELIPSIDVGSGRCPTSSLKLRLEYQASIPGDCNANAIPDVCDLITGELTDADGDGYPDECAPFPEPCPGDVDGDGDTDVFDFADLADGFGLGPGALRDEGDLTGDGWVDVFDFADLAEDFGCQ